MSKVSTEEIMAELERREGQDFHDSKCCIVPSEEDSMPASEEHEIQVSTEQERVQRDFLELKERVLAFNEECHRRILATSTTEQLSIFNLFKNW